MESTKPKEGLRARPRGAAQDPEHEERQEDQARDDRTRDTPGRVVDRRTTEHEDQDHHAERREEPEEHPPRACGSGSRGRGPDRSSRHGVLGDPVGSRPVSTSSRRTATRLTCSSDIPGQIGRLIAPA